MLEQKFEKSRFVRVDSDVIDNLIRKDVNREVSLSAQEREAMTTVFKSQIPAIEKSEFMVMFEALGENTSPVMITQSEYMRRMKEMAAMQPGMSFYGELPDTFNLIINTDHPLCKKIVADTDVACREQIEPLVSQLDVVNAEIARLNNERKDKKDDEISVADKEALRTAEEKAAELRSEQEKIYSNYAAQNNLVKQLIDLALLSNNMLRGESLNKFVKRSFELLS
jgi:molecular chaperone HtpG